MNTIKTVGVVGAGVMGRGVAQAIAQSDMDAVLIDVSNEVLDAALQDIGQAVRFQSMMNPALAHHTPESVCDRIRTSTDYSALAEIDFLVENISEKVDLKQALYPTLDSICRPECVFAVNTSAVSITRVGGWTKRPDKIVGMHFMNPVPMKPLVEVIRGFHSTEESIARAQEFLGIMGKEGVVVNDMPGFVSNRVLMLTINEAIFLLQDQVAKPRDIDKIFKGCFGHKMGPLETADLIGVDTILYSLDVLLESYGDPKFRPAPLLKKMVDAGLHGRKSGEGFFKYPKI